jgi:hypothetical protein
LKQRAFIRNYRNENLEIGANKINRLKTNSNAYGIMFKIFSTLNGDQELGFFAQSKAEGRATFTDESVAIFNGYSAFTNDSYDNIFNDHTYAQGYHQAGFTYRERLTKRWDIGVKLSANMGVYYNKIDINQSNITFDRANDQAFLTLGGTYYTNKELGNFERRDLLPNFRNPGASISLGTTYRNERGVTWQANVKDLGFIRWSKKSFIYLIAGTTEIDGLSTTDRESRVFDAVSNVTQYNVINRSFTSATDGRAEVSVTKSYWLGERAVKYSPVLIASKQLFTSELTGALVNHFQYRKVVGTFTTSYNSIEHLNIGGQFMVKAPNVEFFIGSERFFQSVDLYRASRKNTAVIGKDTRYSGANVFLGFSVKFGPDIEHPMNASVIPMGEEKGFIGRLWQKIFKPKPVTN